jgi:hypothetical protein
MKDQLAIENLLEELSLALASANADLVMVTCMSYSGEYTHAAEHVERLISALYLSRSLLSLILKQH